MSHPLITEPKLWQPRTKSWAPFHLSFSGATRYRQCPFYFAAQKFLCWPEQSSVPRDRGWLAHAFFSAYAQHCIDHKLGQDPENWPAIFKQVALANPMSPSMEAEVKELAESFVSSHGGFYDERYVQHVEKEIEFIVPGTEAFPFDLKIVVRPDHAQVELYRKLFSVTDYKSSVRVYSREDAESTVQGVTGALGLAHLHPELTDGQGVFILDFIGSDAQLEPIPITASDFERVREYYRETAQMVIAAWEKFKFECAQPVTPETLKNVSAEQIAEFFPARPGHACQFDPKEGNCVFATACPYKAKAQVATIATDEEAHDALASALVLGTQYDTAVKALKAYCQGRGTDKMISCNGKVAGYSSKDAQGNPKEEWTVDVDKAIPVAQERGITLSDVFSFKATTKKAKEFRVALKGAGAAKVEPTVDWTIRKG